MKREYLCFWLFCLILLSSLVEVSPVAGNPAVKTVLLPPLKMLEIQEVLQPFIKAEKVTYSFIQGRQPKLILVGDEAATNRIAALIEKLADRQVAKDLILITASMEETSANNGSATGINLNDIPFTASWKRTNANSTYQMQTTSAIQAGDSSDTLATLKLRGSEDDNRLLVAGQIATTNGMSGNLVLTEEVPYVVVNANGSGQVQYNKAETIIKVKPTLLEYNEEEPAKSLVKLDIDLQISVVADQSNLYSAVSPVITTRRLILTRIIQANQAALAVAALTSDEDLVVEQGIPVLNKLPILKYLFSQKTKVKERTSVILKMAVRFVPQEGPAENDVKSVLTNVKGAGK